MVWVYKHLVPELQLEQPIAPAAAYWPETHASQAEALELGWYCPTPQLEHE